MSNSTPGASVSAAMPARKAFLKALGDVALISLVFCSVIWIREAFRHGDQDNERTAGLIFLLVVVLLLGPTFYYCYRRGLASTPSRGLDIFLGLLGTCLAIGFVISSSQAQSQRRLLSDLIFAIVCFIKAGMYLYRAFKAKVTVSLPS